MSYGQSTIGYKILVFVLLVVAVIFGITAMYLNAEPDNRETVVVTEIVMVTPTPSALELTPAADLLAERTADLDDLTILKLLLGEAAQYQFSDADGKAEAVWVPGEGDLGDWPITGERDYLTRVIDIHSDADVSIERVLVFFKTGPVVPIFNECDTLVGSAALAYEKGDWVVAEGQLAIQPPNGLCLVPEIEEIALNDAIRGLVFHYDYEEDGETVKLDEIYTKGSAGYRRVLSLEVYRDNAALCAASRNCFSTIRNYVVLPAEGLRLGDLLVSVRGTVLVDGQLAVVNEETLYRYQVGEYRLLEE